MKARHLLSLVLAVMLVPGCCHLPSSAKGARREHLSSPRLAEFTCPTLKEFVCQEKEVEANRKYVVKRIELTGLPPCAGADRTNRNLVFDYFLPRTAEKHPILVILPMLGGSYPLEKYFGSYFAKRGFASIIVHRQKIAKDSNLDALDRLLRESVLDNRQAIDWIETRAELDAGRIGVFGISMGAIKGALLTPLEPRVRAATLGLVGGDLPYILTYTTEKGISKRRDEILREQHLTLAEAHEKLKKSVTCDPNEFGEFVQTDKVLLILGACDTVVPTKKGLELRKKMGKPETVIVPTGHYSAILFLPYIQWQCYKFFQRKLALPVREPVRANVGN
jgi:hypothetical protein